MKKEIAAGKNLEELMALADELSRGYFRQGLNCSECVLRTFMDIYETGLPEEIICMATGFGGGKRSSTDATAIIDSFTAATNENDELDADIMTIFGNN